MANILFVLAFTGLIFECVSTEHQARPGIRLRVTDKGLQYGKKYTVTLRVERSLSSIRFFQLFKPCLIVFLLNSSHIHYHERACFTLIQCRREVC